MAYSPDPDRRPIPADVWAFLATFCGMVALFTFAPVIARALVGAFSGA